MAKNKQQLKRRIKTSQNIAQIAKAMEMISASKIKKAQYAVLNNKPYAQKITDLTASLTKNSDLKTLSHPYFTINNSAKKLYIIISQDKGLCGSLTTNLFKKILEIDSNNIKYVTLGKKAERFCARLEGELIASFSIGTSIPDYKLVYHLLEIIEQTFLAGSVCEVSLLYSEFQSIFAQIPIVKNVLPMDFSSSEISKLPYVFEPDSAKILLELLPYYVEVMLYGAILEAYTSEQAARMVAMQNAKNNALDIAQYLTLEYNKSRQERITNEILDIANNVIA